MRRIEATYTLYSEDLVLPNARVYANVNGDHVEFASVIIPWKLPNGTIFELEARNHLTMRVREELKRYVMELAGARAVVPSDWGPDDVA